VKRIVVVVAALVLGFATSATAAAGAAETATDISRDVMSPFCPGLTLHDCPSAAASDLRDRIEKWVRAGRSRDQIMSRLRDDYGPAIWASPPADGAGALAWLLPALAVAAGAALATRAARRWRSAPRPRSSGAPASSDERRRLAGELAELRRRT
jgi:cytochrome c-type biogenesis protein CcmH/NrfF